MVERWLENGSRILARVYARKLFRATDFCRQRFTIAADFIRRFGWSALEARIGPNSE